MAALDGFKALSEKMEKEKDELGERFSKHVTIQIKRQLAEWSARFPRHTFTAWEAHGLLAFDVSPPVMGEKSVEYLNRERGAIGELGKQAQEFIDIYNTEWKIGLYPSQSTIKL